MRHTIFTAIQRALEELGVADANFVVERPGDMAHGDYATNAALVASKFVSRPPRALAEELAQKLSDRVARGDFQGIKEVRVAGPGFINLFLTAEAILSELTTVASGAVPIIETDVSGTTVLIEYTSPNLFKPLHIGNLVGNIVGESIARLLEASGADVRRINYPSDIGLTVAKGVWGLMHKDLDPTDIKQLGEAYVAGNAAYEGDAEAKAEIESINTSLYEGDEKLSALREAGIQTSLRHLDALCKTLGTSFDTVIFESQSAEVGKALVLEHEGSVFEKSDGAVVYRGEKEGLHTRVFINSLGLPTYEAKDLGLYALKRQAYPEFGLSITVTGSEQREYFKVLFAAVRRVFAEDAGKGLLHIPTGFLRLTTGKMSSRKGNVITGESLLHDLIEASKEKMGERTLANADKTAEEVAVGAVKYAVLKQGSGKDIVFDPEKSLSLEGDSGPYLQYAHTRALSLLKKADAAGITGVADANLDQASPLERLLIHFPEVLERAAGELEPHYVTTYLTELASAFNSWYASERVIGGEHPERGVLLAQAFANTMKRGLGVLGIPAPEEM